jgi:hypothetical protein
MLHQVTRHPEHHTEHHTLSDEHHEVEIVLNTRERYLRVLIPLSKMISEEENAKGQWRDVRTSVNPNIECTVNQDGIELYIPAAMADTWLSASAVTSGALNALHDSDQRHAEEFIAREMAAKHDAEVKVIGPEEWAKRSTPPADTELPF